MHSAEDIIEVNSKNKTISFGDGSKLKFSKCLLSCGSEKLKEFEEYENVFQLNSIKDHAKIHNSVKDSKRVVIYGSNFEAYELASSVKELAESYGNEDIEVYIVEPPISELLRSFGEQVHQTLKAFMYIKGIKVLSKLKVIATRSNEGSSNLDVISLYNEDTNRKIELCPDLVLTELNLGKSNVPLSEVLM